MMYGVVELIFQMIVDIFIPTFPFQDPFLLVKCLSPTARQRKFLKNVYGSSTYTAIKTSFNNILLVGRLLPINL